MERVYLKDIDDKNIEVELIRYFRYNNTNYLIYTKNETDEKGYIKLYLVKVMESLGKKIARSIKDDIEWGNMQKIVKKVIKEIKEKEDITFVDLNSSEVINLKVGEPRYFKLDPKLVDILGSDSVMGSDKKSIFEEKQENNEILVNEQNVEIPTNDAVSTEPVNIEPINVEPILENNNIPLEVEEETKENYEQIDSPKYIPEETISIFDSVDNKEIKEQTETDYKKMYEEVYKEKEELDEILSDMVIELTNYKIKYGELEEA